MYIQLLSFISEATPWYRVQFFSTKPGFESVLRTIWIDTVSQNPLTVQSQNSDGTYNLRVKTPPAPVINNYVAT